jgi:hypothetical protein
LTRAIIRELTLGYAQHRRARARIGLHLVGARQDAAATAQRRRGERRTGDGMPLCALAAV